MTAPSDGRHERELVDGLRAIAVGAWFLRWRVPKLLRLLRLLDGVDPDSLDVGCPSAASRAGTTSAAAGACA